MVDDNTQIDTFGDAHELLMNMYSFQTDKSDGEFFTSQEVLKLPSRITLAGNTHVIRIYEEKTFIEVRYEAGRNMASNANLAYQSCPYRTVLETNVVRKMHATGGSAE